MMLITGCLGALNGANSRNLYGGKMLSSRTVAFLKELADSSHLAYPEGGLLFRYQYDFKQAHRFLKTSMQDTLHVDELNNLARFFQGALGDPTEDSAKDHAVLSAGCLIEHLREDLQYDLVDLVVEEGNYDMTATFEMASRLRNDYSRLDLFWSVD
ncbi:hypothetical protein [Pseudomonas sp.]|uniref:hypothetical protein n=1 Tax=Pseudomonas sp. TaxID=306 RepID=UPI0028A9DD60|nr:hypothetical protein [Pseudomonas sp.]